jgi:hypothetical protein
MSTPVMSTRVVGHFLLQLLHNTFPPILLRSFSVSPSPPFPHLLPIGMKRKQHRACYQCRQDHKKCDGSPWPCQRCVKLGLADSCGDGPPAKRGKTLRAMEELEKRAKGNMFEWKYGASPGLGFGMGVGGEIRRSSEPGMTPRATMFPDYDEEFRHQHRERETMGRGMKLINTAH